MLLQVKTHRRAMRGKSKVVLAVMLLSTMVAVVYQYIHTQEGRKYQDSLLSLPLLEAGIKRQVRDKWIVTSSLNTLNVSNILGWTVLVYGVRSKYCRSPVCKHLDDELSENTQKYSSDISRELTAKLIAVSRGAAFVFAVTEWRDDMSYILNRFVFAEVASGIVAKTDKATVDTKTIFSSESSQIHNTATLLVPPHHTFYEYVLLENLHPLIQSIVSSHHIKSKSPQTTTYLPPVFLPVDTFISLEFEMTLFHYDVFWAFIFKNVPFGDLVVQKVLWEIDGQVMVYPGGTVKQFEESRRSELNDTSHIELIQRSECKDSWSILDCLVYLTKLLREKGLITTVHERNVMYWILHLRSIGYKSPRRSLKKKDSTDQQTVGVFSPIRQQQEKNVALRELKKICPQNKLRQPKNMMRDIALIISFNSPDFYRNIPLLEAMYKPYFQHMIYCGPNIGMFRPFANNYTTGYFIFIEALKQGWLYMFECTVHAMKMNLNVKGFLQIGDDTLLNSWNVWELPRNKIWLHTGIRSEDSSLKMLKPRWVWWRDGKRGLNNVIKDMRLGRAYHKQTDLEFRFLENFKNASKDFTKFYIQGCDFMYTPASLKDDYIKTTKLLIKHKVMLELGIPNIALGLQRWKDIHFVEDGSLWENRFQNLEKYRTDLVFLHPFKLKQELQRKGKGRKLFCDAYMNGHE